MSLKKAILHGKEKRKPYYGSKRFDSSCRPHGGRPGKHVDGCPYCQANREHSTQIKKLAANQSILNYSNETN